MPSRILFHIVYLTARFGLSLRTKPSQGAVQVSTQSASANSAVALEARYELDFLGSILDAAYGSSAPSVVAFEGARDAVSNGHTDSHSQPVAPAIVHPEGATAAAVALSRVLRASSSGVGYLGGLLSRAKEAQSRSFARVWNLLNVTSAGVDRLDGVARGLKESYATMNVLNSTHNDSVAALWAGYQEDLMSAIQSSYPQGSQTLRVLVVSPVAGDEAAIATFAYNLEKLTGNRAGDHFDFALFHYDGNATLWERAPWYFGTSSPIVSRITQPLCKGHAWTTITPELARRYDYVWLMDGDLQLDYFSWDLYRSVLVAMEPLVSQPAILAREGGERSTDIGELRMVGLEGGAFPIAREVNRSESMASVLSTRLWPAIHERLRGNDPTTIWYATDFWDLVAYAAARACGRAGVLLVNAAPVRHLNRHDLLAPGSIGESHNCTKGCGEGSANCRPVSSTEKQLVSDGLRGYCSLPPESSHLSCEGDWIRQCQWDLAAGFRRREWSVVHSGRVSTLRYRCNASSEASMNSDPCRVAAVWPE